MLPAKSLKEQVREKIPGIEELGEEKEMEPEFIPRLSEGMHEQVIACPTFAGFGEQEKVPPEGGVLSIVKFSEKSKENWLKLSIAFTFTK